MVLREEIDDQRVRIPCADGEIRGGHAELAKKRIINAPHQVDRHRIIQNTANAPGFRRPVPERPQHGFRNAAEIRPYFAVVLQRTPLALFFGQIAAVKINGRMAPVQFCTVISNCKQSSI